MLHHHLKIMERNITNGVPKKTRNAIKRADAKWKNGEVPYTVHRSFSDYERGVIAKAMKEYHKNTCIKGSLLSLTNKTCCRL